MPDANGNFKGVYISQEAWERIFGSRTYEDMLEDAADRIQGLKSVSADDLTDEEMDILEKHTRGTE